MPNLPERETYYLHYKPKTQIISVLDVHAKSERLIKVMRLQSVDTQNQILI